MVSTFISLLDIQSWWEIPCIAHFCSLFSSAFNLPDIDIEDLESALLTDGTDENVGLLPELIVHLLKGCDKLRKLKKRITTSNYQMFLRRFLRHQCRLHKIENYFDTDIDFQSLPLRNKLLILHSLCHFRLDSEDVQYILSNLEADSLRVEPLGYDSKNSGYWYFYGTRLYREDTKPGGKNTVWQVICFTEEDWQNLATKFKNSSSPKERALHDILVENFLPKLPQLFREREKLRRKKLLQVRNSARIRNHLEEKLKRETAELAERQQIDEELKIDTAATAANKYKSGRIRRRSQSSSTASGISTYASSIRAALSDSTEFLVQREKFCLSPEDDIYFSSSSKSITPPTTTSSSHHHYKQQNSNRKTQKYKRKVEDNSDKFLKQKISKIQKEFENESHYESDISSLNDSAADISNDDNDDNNLIDRSSVIIKQEENKENYYIKRKLLLLSSSYQESEEDNLSVKSSKSSSGFVESKLEIMAPTTNIKLPGRKTNNSLSSLTGNIFIPPQIFGNSSTSGGGTQEDHFEMTSDNNHKGNNKEKPSTSSTSSSLSSSLPSSLSASVTNNSDNTTTQQKKKKTKASSEIFTETDEVLQIGMHKVLVYVKNHRDAWPFMDPVEEDIAPRYYSIIRRPMDLLKMEDKLDNGEYTKFSEFRNDFKLIVNNCRLYNGQNNEYTEMVNNLQEAFEKATRKYFDQYSSDEEGNLGYPDSKTNVFREKHFNKNNSTKVNQKESSSITTTNIANIATAADKKCSNKEKQDKTHILSDNVSTNKKYEKQQNNDQGPNENLKGTKRKRKDKDKRRKKKIKLKSNSNKTLSTQQMDSTENEDDNDDGNDDDKDNDNDICSNHIKNSGKQQKFEEMNSDADERENDDTNLKKKNNNLNKSKMKKQKNRNGRNISPTPAINVIPPNKKLKQQKSKGATTVGRTQKNLQSKTKSNSKKTPPNEKIIENKQQSNNNKSGRTGKSVKKESKLIHHSEDTEDMLNEENVKKEDIKNNADYRKKGGKRLNEKQSSTNTSTNNKNKTKQEKENQSIKSKSVNVIKDEKKDSLNKVKDNKIRSGTNNKKKKGKSNKKNETTTQTQNTQQKKLTTSAISNHIKEEQHQQQHTVVDYDSDNDKNDNEKNYVDNYSFSRSPSPLYKVDLHKKYAKSASLQFDDEFIFSSSKITSSNEDNKNKKSTTTKTTLTSKLNRDNEELMSISSRSLSRSLSPSVVMNTTELSTKNNGKKDRTKKSSKDNNNKKNDKRKNGKRNSSVVASRSQSSSLESSSVDKIQQKQQQQQKASSAESDKKEEIIPLFLDKYDLIKQRRSRNTTATTTEEKWNQIVKEAEKIKDTKKNAKSNILSTSKEKNQKLKETIEKLKEKNAKSKERSVLIDEIFGVKPTQEIRDERKIFEKSRETKPETSAGGSGNKSTSNSSSETGQHKEHNETDFVQDVPVSPNKSSPKKKERNHHHEKSKNTISGKKSSSNKGCSSSGSGSKNKENSDRKTNMEALELETEQTLKDINRWLEHTPRLSEFSSASNSPSRYNLLDDFDAVASKLDPNDFRRPVPITPAKIDPNGPKLTDSFEEFSTTNNNSCIENKRDVISSLISAANVVNAEDSASNTANSLSIVIPSTSSSSPLTPPIISAAISTTSSSPSTKLKDTNTTQLLPHPPPPPPHIKTQQQKEAKRKSLKEKLQAVTSKRKDPLRTIDRLQPGKSKGNLISNMHGNKSDEIFPLGASAKIKEVKNALVVKTDETAPKLSLGSVLNTEGFGFGQLHNFGTDSGSSVSMKISDVISNCSGEKSERKEDGTSSDEMMEKAEEVETTTKEVSPTEKKFESKSEKTLATPNLSAWFKAFGAPKKAKKLEEEEKKSDIVEETQNNINNAEQSMETSSIAATTTSISTTFSTLKSPSSTMENFSLPAPRTRKASTGSTVSERSSFSQDPDSPRVGIDDRFGGYSGPYASPIGASPIMVSPKPDEIGKPTSPYPLNGAIKVGFYQDTTTKSSPEKSCSPRELPSPYPQYSQHVYTSASSPSVGTEIGTASYGTSCYSVSGGGNDDINKNASPAPVYPTNSTVTLYEQYKQPNSHESDYNSTMSPSTNPNSPYQQSQNSPYQQNPNSPYQQSQNSPYHQPQNSPYQGQASSNNSSIIQTKSPTSHQQQSPQGSHSPYQQSINSPYQQSNNSPYNQQSASSPYHAQSQSQTQTQSQVQQQQVNMNFNQQQVDSPQQQPSESPYSQESPQYQIHESSQFQQQTDQTQQQNQSTFESKMTKDSDTNSSLVTKIHNPSEWVNPQMDISNSNSQNNSAPTLTELSPMVSSHAPNQLNSTQQLHNEQQQQQQIRLHQPQDNKMNLPFQNYPQYPIANKGNSMIQHQQDISQSSGLKRPSQTNESEVLSLSNFAESQPPNKTSKCDSDKPFDSTLNKHQQMFDSFLGSMAGNKNLGFGRPPVDISTSKAFEMFNRAATYGLSKEFPNNLLTSNKMDTNSIQLQQISQQQQQHQQQQHQTKNANNITGSGKSIIHQSNFNQEHLVHHQQQQQQHQSLENSTKLQAFQNTLSETSDTTKMNPQQTGLFTQKLNGNQGNMYSNPNLVQSPSMGEKLSNELVVSNSSRQDQQMADMNRNQTLNMDYKQTYNSLRNLNHPLSMMDDNMLNLQNVSSTGCYDKNIPPSAHVFGKGGLIPQQSYHQNSPYETRDQQNLTVGNYIPSSVPIGNNDSNLIQQTQMPDGIDPKTFKRVKKKKSSTPTPVVEPSVVNNQNRNSMIPMTGQTNHSQTSTAQSIQPLSNVSAQNIHEQQQGFQLYAGLKTASVSATTDSSAISLKTAATSMVPGSAFNFGPSPTGLGLSSGIYGDNSGYLDEFRGPHNPYYTIPPGHRPSPEVSTDKSSNAPPPPSPGPSPSTYHQFLTHSSSRTSYPFMNSPQLDPNSPIYQQYLQRQDELRARMMLNQTLLAPSPAPGYPQASYRPPIGMPKHYDMNRQPWF